MRLDEIFYIFRRRIANDSEVSAYLSPSHIYLTGSVDIDLFPRLVLAFVSTGLTGEQQQGPWELEMFATLYVKAGLNLNFDERKSFEIANKIHNILVQTKDSYGQTYVQKVVTVNLPNLLPPDPGNTSFRAIQSEFTVFVR